MKITYQLALFESCHIRQVKKIVSQKKFIPCFEYFQSWIEFGDPNESVIRQISANGNIDFPEIDESEGWLDTFIRQHQTTDAVKRKVVIQHCRIENKFYVACTYLYIFRILEFRKRNAFWISIGKHFQVNIQTSSYLSSLNCFKWLIFVAENSFLSLDFGPHLFWPVIYCSDWNNNKWLLIICERKNIISWMYICFLSLPTSFR